MRSSGLLAHSVIGEGEPLLMLNGAMMTWAAWGPISAPLAERHRVVLCDLRGQLMSPGPVPADLTENLGDLVALLDHLELDAVHVLGASYGGELGLLMAALRPERVRSLIAVTVSDVATEAIHQGSEDMRELISEALGGGDRGLLHDRVAGEVYSRSYRERYRDELAARRGQVAALPDAWFEGVRSIAAAIETLDLRPYLHKIVCPTLVVVAADDRTIPPERSYALAEAIGGAEVLVHETSGHALVAEDPAWLVEASIQFLARQGADTQSSPSSPGSPSRRAGRPEGS